MLPRGKSFDEQLSSKGVNEPPIIDTVQTDDRISHAHELQLKCRALGLTKGVFCWLLPPLRMGENETHSI